MSVLQRVGGVFLLFVFSILIYQPILSQQASASTPPHVIRFAQTTPPVDEGEEDGTEPDQTCEEIMQQEGGIGWWMCPLLTLVDNGANELLEQLNDLLEVDPSQYNDERLQEAWGYFRNIASFLLLVVGLVMVLGQALNKE